MCQYIVTNLKQEYMRQMCKYIVAWPSIGGVGYHTLGFSVQMTQLFLSNK